MKMNKLAAGALALALGLGAVAPAVASENGTGLIEHEYNAQITRAQKFFNLREDARKKLTAAETRYEVAKKAQKAAKDKYDNLPEDKPGETLPTTETAWVTKLDGAKTEVQDAIKEVNKAKDKKESEYDGAVDAAKKAAKEAAVKAAEQTVKEKSAALDKLASQYGEWSKKQKENLPDFDKAKLAPKAQAYVDLMKANEELSAAYAAYGVAINNEYEANVKFQQELGFLKTWAEGVNAIVKVEGTKIVVKPAKEEGKKSVAEAVKALKASIDDNKAAVKSAEFLLQNAPKSVAKVKAKLEAQIVKAKAAITKGEAALAKVEKKMAFIATAYAAEDDVKVEDLEALTKENKESASDINNTIKENEKEQPAVEEEKKPEEKKPEENKPARKAGKNAKTGIAGIAGVAGILAAASVAYAASKRD